MDTQITTHTVKAVESDALIVYATRTKNGLVLGKRAREANEALDGLILERQRAGEFKGSAGELLTMHTLGRLATPRVLVVGLGEPHKLDIQSIQRAYASASRYLQQTGARRIALALELDSEHDPHDAQAALEGVLLGLYRFRIYQSSQNGQPGVSALTLLVEESEQAKIQEIVARGQVLADATNFARSLINEPGNVLSPGELAKRARTMANEVGLECEIFDLAKIRELGMGGLLGVSQGSAQPPYFIILRYRGAPGQQGGLALVGKGITFDSGGISIKPAASMDEMKGDMGGAAAVLGGMQAIAQLKPQINVTAFIPTCENMPGGSSYRPGDILRMYNGKTIEIVNTDAEGRLILADALAYANEQGLSPIVDLATLTGGVMVALGTIRTGLFSNDEKLRDEILAAGAHAGEKYWPLPLDEEYGEMIQSDIADIKQSAGRWASAVTAAKILEQFVGDAKWSHLDIAGTSYYDSQKPYQEKGATGVGVRTLAELARRLAEKSQE